MLIMKMKIKKMVTSKANSVATDEMPNSTDEMPNSMAFHQCLHCLLKQKWSSEKEIQNYLEPVTP